MKCKLRDCLLVSQCLSVTECVRALMTRAPTSEWDVILLWRSASRTGRCIHSMCAHYLRAALQRPEHTGRTLSLFNMYALCGCGEWIEHVSCEHAIWNRIHLICAALHLLCAFALPLFWCDRCGFGYTRLLMQLTKRYWACTKRPAPPFVNASKHDTDRWLRTTLLSLRGID
jgi:hypothetical protein